MNKKLKWLIGLAVAVLLVGAIAVPAFANGAIGNNGKTASSIDVDNDTEFGYGNCMGLGFGPDEAVTDLLGLTADQIREQRLAGKSLVEIAAAQDVTEEELINAIMTEKQTQLQEMVAAGTISQETADLRLAQMKERVTLSVNRTQVGPPEWAGANGKGQQGGQGMMGQGNRFGTTRDGQGNIQRNQGACGAGGGMMRGGNVR
jgi:hypothetical protein